MSSDEPLGELPEEDLIPACPKCAGEPKYLGWLGRREWFRCTQCGWDYSQLLADDSALGGFGDPEDEDPPEPPRKDGPFGRTDQ